MEIQSLLIFLLALIIAVISSWSLSTFLKLHKAIGNFDSDQTLLSKCNFSKNYVEVGKTMAILLLVVSVLVLIASSVWFILSLR